MRSSVRWAVLAVVSLTTAAWAQQGSPPRISVAPVRGDKNNAVGSQLTGELCKVYDCVPFAKVSTKGKPDFKKTPKEKVAGVFTTTISKTKKGYTAGVALLMGSSKVKKSWSFPLTSKRNLSNTQVKQLVHDSGPYMGFAEDVSGVAAIAAAESARTAAPPPPVATTTPQSRMDTVPPPTSVTEPIPPPPGAAPAERSLADTPVAADASSSSSSSANTSGMRGQPIVSVEVGVNFLNRNLTYTPSTQTELLTYDASLIGLLYAGVEFYPFAKGGGFFGGLGFFGSFQFAIGLTSQSQTDPSVQESTSFSMLSAGIEERIRPIKYSDFAITIPIAFRKYKFDVSNSNLFLGPTGAPGFPNQDLLGVSAGLKLEIPIGSWFVILLGGDYVFWFKKEQLIGSTFYQSGSAGAFEGEVGFGIYIVGPLSVRVLGEYSSTNYSFDPDANGTYTATGATDRLLGARVTLRLDF